MEEMCYAAQSITNCNLVLLSLCTYYMYNPWLEEWYGSIILPRVHTTSANKIVYRSPARVTPGPGTTLYQGIGSAPLLYQ